MTAIATTPNNKTLSKTERFWKMVAKELDGETWENLLYVTGIPQRRMHWLKSDVRGIGTMSAEELLIFSKLLNMDPIDLIIEHGCGGDKITLDEANAIVKDRGQVWAPVAHVA